MLVPAAPPPSCLTATPLPQCFFHKSVTAVASMPSYSTAFPCACMTEVGSTRLFSPERVTKVSDRFPGELWAKPNSLGRSAATSLTWTCSFHDFLSETVSNVAMPGNSGNDLRYDKCMCWIQRYQPVGEGIEESESRFSIFLSNK